MNGNIENEAPAKKEGAEAIGLKQKLKSFWKINSDTVSKLYVHQFGLTVFGMLLYQAASVSKNVPLVIGLGIFSTVFYLFLLYVLAWDVGAKDKIKIDGGRLQLDPVKGAKFAFAGMIPNLFIAVLAFIGFIFKTAVGADWAIGLYGVAQLVGVYLNAMYLGIGDVTGIAYQPYYLFVICIPAIAVCGVGYRLGVKEKFGVLTSNGKGRKNR